MVYIEPEDKYISAHKKFCIEVITKTIKVEYNLVQILYGNLKIKI